MTGTASKRTFYRTIVEIEVLSEEPYDPVSLDRLHYDITDGGCSGKWRITSSKAIDGKECAEALLAQGSEPEFFMLNDRGEDTECP